MQKQLCGCLFSGTYNPEYSETVAAGAGITLEKGTNINERILILSVYSI